MKVKVTEASGIVLDWMVAKCEDDSLDEFGKYYDTGWGEGWHYTTEWAVGGPIIEREKIGISECFGTWTADWYAPKNSNRDGISMLGKSPLEAAMRCYVVSKLGDEVEVPDELTEEK